MARKNNDNQFLDENGNFQLATLGNIQINIRFLEEIEKVSVTWISVDTNTILHEETFENPEDDGNPDVDRIRFRRCLLRNANKGYAAIYHCLPELWS